MLLETYRQKSEQLNTLRKEVNLSCKAAFAEGVEELFAKYPSLESFSWRQYAPSFNDGDPCYFSAHTEYPNVTIDGEEIEEGYAEEGTFHEEVCNAVRSFLGLFDDDAYEDMYGDGIEVTVTKDGIETDYYDYY